MRTIAYLNQLLGDEQMQKDVVKSELVEVREKFGDKRRTEITHAVGDITMEDLIADDAVAITISHWVISNVPTFLNTNLRKGAVVDLKRARPEMQTLLNICS